MELDFSEEWRIVPTPAGEAGKAPCDFAAAELSAILGRMGCRPPAHGNEGDLERIIVLNRGSGGAESLRRFSWRASPDRVEIYGSDGASLLRGAYDFLRALGARWPAPGAAAERLPTGPRLGLETASRASGDRAAEAVLALGSGAFLERGADYLEWAARAGYSSVLVRLAASSSALEGAPAELYESLRGGLAELARRLGLALELAGAFRGAEDFAAYAAAHPEASVFHLWPEGPWNFAAAEPRVPVAERLADARALAAALSSTRPDASLSFLADEEDADLPEAIAAAPLPPGIGLLWAPRRRSWAAAIGDPGSILNAASLSLFRETVAAWRRAGGGRALALERYEDAFLFKGAVPPLPTVIEGDLAAYRAAATGEEADAIGILCGGERLPLAPRPNVALVAALAADPALGAEAALGDWSEAAYGEEAPSMREYWRELEAAWAIDLDLAEGETGVRAPAALARAASEPPADWGDPWMAGAERLAARRGRCEELFDRLRRAEAILAEARGAGEADEYAVAGALLELDCARLAAYHELASGEESAAADIANLALSASAALRKALARVPDPRGRREARLVVRIFYELRLREMRRLNARSAIRRLLDRWASETRLAWDGKTRASSLARAPRRR